TSSPQLVLVNGFFAGELRDELLFPYPDPLDARNAAEAETVRRLIDDLHGMVSSGLIDSVRFDEQEFVDEDVITAFAKSGLLSLTIPKQYGGLELSSTAYSRVFGELAVVDASLAVLVGVHCGLGG